jgi:hypothetical protein
MTRDTLIAVIVGSHTEQAKSIKSRLESGQPFTRSARDVLWTLYFSHLETSDALLATVGEDKS